MKMALVDPMRAEQVPGVRTTGPSFPIELAGRPRSPRCRSHRSRPSGRLARCGIMLAMGGPPPPTMPFAPIIPFSRSAMCIEPALAGQHRPRPAAEDLVRSWLAYRGPWRCCGRRRDQCWSCRSTSVGSVQKAHARRFLAARRGRDEAPGSCRPRIRRWTRSSNSRCIVRICVSAAYEQAVAAAAASCHSPVRSMRRGWPTAARARAIPAPAYGLLSPAPWPKGESGLCGAPRTHVTAGARLFPPVQKTGVDADPFRADRSAPTLLQASRPSQRSEQVPHRLNCCREDSSESNRRPEDFQSNCKAGWVSIATRGSITPGHPVRLSLPDRSGEERRFCPNCERAPNTLLAGILCVTAALSSSCLPGVAVRLYCLCRLCA